MEKIKAYTDLEQSEKLAKILPIESADNYYSWHDERYYIVNKDCHYPYSLKEKIPCWSLSALLSVMPKEVKIKGQMYAPCLFPITDGHWLYKLWYNSNEIIESPIAVWCDNPLDACVEMIIKLHELNLL